MVDVALKKKALDLVQKGKLDSALRVFRLLLEQDPDEVIAIHEALCKLERIDPRKAQAVELVFFGGLTMADAAEVLKVAIRTVKADWAAARAWLHQQVSAADPPADLDSSP